MKKILINSIIGALALLVCFSCKKQNVATPLKLQNLKTSTSEYLANLRAYKSRPHEVTFAWFAGFTNGNVPNMNNRLEDIPDSIDIVSFFEGPGSVPPPNNPGSLVMQNIQKTKGTKFVVGIFSSVLDGIRIANFGNLPVLIGIDSLAKAVADTLTKYHLDGLDVDYEPSFGDGGIFGHGGGGTNAGGDVYTQRLFTSLSKYIGPLSNSGKLLIIDGENEPGIASQINYLAQQAYGASSDSDLQSRFEQYGFGILPPGKFIACDWTQQATTDFNGQGIISFYGFAAWEPTQGHKGGAGMYQGNDDFPNYSSSNHPGGNLAATPYPTLRHMIQIMNPAVR